MKFIFIIITIIIKLVIYTHHYIYISFDMYNTCWDVQHGVNFVNINDMLLKILYVFFKELI
jgi:hypothetical protein